MKARRNDSDREDYVINDEGFYLWWKREMRGERKLREFVREHRAEIDAAIDRPREDLRLGYMQGRGAA